MKTKLITCALLLTAFVVNAQTTEKKEATVRIKKIENINGVEKITDTTYTTSDPSSIKVGDGSQIEVIKFGDGQSNGQVKKVVIVGDKDMITGDDPRVDAVHIGEGMDAEMEKALKETGVGPNAKCVKKVVIVNEDSEPSKDGKMERKISKVIIIKMNVTDASPEDKKRLATQIGTTNNKLTMDNITMAPNPNSGKFNLKFNLKNQGDTEVTVFDIEGKQVYSEKLPNFVGDYNKSVDIGGNQKGVYFVKIMQGKDSQVKKVILE